MPISAAERERLIQQYAQGPARLRAALAKVPEEARKWRPGAGKWSAHEVVVHCADSETTAAGRIRFLLAEKEPLILGYDQDCWATTLDYHSHPLEPALVAIEAVRANTVPLLRSLPDSAWDKVGRHTESGAYSGDRWLQIYAGHLEQHSAQIERNVAAWQAVGKARA
jgi:hypothetical protein